MANYPDLITCDMGGTSTDVCLVRGGEYGMTTEGKVGAFPIKIRQIDINTIGVGGGSIASRSSGGFLTVGPRSAGAFPGPASYGRGGTEPTLSDANVVLGRLRVDRPLGGEIKLDRQAAMTAIGGLATAIGISSVEMAEGILRIAAVSLAGAIKEVSVMRGIDPRDFALLPFGGAGALHAAEVADELGMETVVIPPLPGNFSALGLLLADSRRDFVKTHLSRTADTTVEAVRSRFAELIATGEKELLDVSSGSSDRRYLASLDMRYSGQSFELSVPCAVDVADIETIERKFGEVYAARYGATTKAAIEIVSYRVALWQIAEKPVLPMPEAIGRSVKDAMVGTTAVIFGSVSHDIPIYQRDLLPPKVGFQGPALVEEEGSSTLVPPDWNAMLDHVGCLVLRRA
jgi:N-methylhydantoinase A